MPDLVIGQSGFIGNSIYSRLKNKIDFLPTNWTNSQLEHGLRNLESNHIDRFFWAAGNNDNTSNQLNVKQEMGIVEFFLNFFDLKKFKIHQLNLISSAGAIYAGCNDTYIDDLTAPKPISEYGKAKLLIEEIFVNFALKNKIELNIFRLTNVFGKKKFNKKTSGLINNLITANINKIPINIFVPLFTKQDYIDIDFVCSNVDSISKKYQNSQINKYILSRNYSHSIQELISIINNITHKKTPFVMQSSENTKVRNSNLYFKSDYRIFTTPINTIEFEIRKLILELINTKSA